MNEAGSCRRPARELPPAAGQASLLRRGVPLRLGLAGCGLGAAHGARRAGPVTPDAHGHP